jgi:hypothetical protein
MDFLNNWLLEDLMYNDILLFLVSPVLVLLMNNRNVLLLNESLMFLVNDWLMVLMDVLLNDDGLEMLMNDILMVLMNYVFSMLNNHVLVMFMDDILMNFFHNRSSDMSPYISSKLVLLNNLSFIGLLEDGLLFVSDHDWFLVDLLHDDFTAVVSLNKCSSMSQLGVLVKS